MEEPNQTRLVAGGDRVHYPGNAGTPTADLLTVQLLINSTIDTLNAKYMTMDIKDFYLNTPMAQYKYMQIQIANMPDDVIKHNHLTDLATQDGYVTAFHRPESLPNNYLRNDYNNMDIVKAKQHPAYGNMTHNQSPSPWLLTTLG
jgi:hypothetical protein